MSDVRDKDEPSLAFRGSKDVQRFTTHARRGSMMLETSKELDWMSYGAIAAATQGESPEGHRRDSLSSISLLLSGSDAFRNKTTSADRKMVLETGPTVDPYRVLGVRRNATSKEIHDAYLKLSLLFHPHRRRSGVKASDTITLDDRIQLWKFIVISASYETLSDIDYRTNYNYIYQNLGALHGEQGTHFSKTSFWDDVKNVLKISDSNEEFLDHDGVPCCNYDYALNERESSRFPRDDVREEDNEYSREINTSIRESPIPKPLMARDESEQTDPGQNDVSTSDTDGLFGGPLAALYKARDHEPFTDALCLFAREFGSEILSDVPGVSNQRHSMDNNIDLVSQKWLFTRTKDSWQDLGAHPKHASTDKKVYPSLPLLPSDTLKKLCNEPALVLGEQKRMRSSTNNNTVVTRRSRCIGSECLVRTEKVTRDPKTGKKVTLIEVRREPVSDDYESDTDLKLLFCSPLPLAEYLELITELKQLLAFSPFTTNAKGGNKSNDWSKLNLMQVMGKRNDAWNTRNNAHPSDTLHYNQ